MCLPFGRQPNWTIYWQSGTWTLQIVKLRSVLFFLISRIEWKYMHTRHWSSLSIIVRESIDNHSFCLTANLLVHVFPRKKCNPPTTTTQVCPAHRLRKIRRGGRSELFEISEVELWHENHQNCVILLTKDDTITNNKYLDLQRGAN